MRNVIALSTLCAALAGCGPTPRTGAVTAGAQATGPHANAADPGEDAVTPTVIPGAGAAADPPAANPTPIADHYREAAGRILAAARADTGAWDKLAYLTDRIGHRLSGSKALERAIAWAVAAMKADGLDDVRTEKVMVPHWVRGAESAEILAPLAHQLHILGLGGTVGTPRDGVTGEVVVVESFDDLTRLGADAIRGKIVLFNAAMPDRGRDAGGAYGDTVGFRVAGPSAAAKLGARAALVRSMTTRSMRTPHTGALGYADGVARIPAAAVALEDADLIARLVAAGEVVKVRLSLGARTLPDAESANVIGELRGRELPDEIVLVSGHIDSWDVGQGAHDDGAGCVVAMQVPVILRRLGLVPRRTIRVVLYTNEENGLRGGREYARAHADELPNHVMALESDTGGFAPRGYTIEGSEQALAHMRDIVTLLAPLGATDVEMGYSGADIRPMRKAGVNLLGQWVDETHYFDYHHTHADTLDKVDPAELAANVAAMAVVAYVIADMPERLGGTAEAGGRAVEAP